MKGEVGKENMEGKGRNRGAPLVVANMLHFRLVSYL